MDADAQRAVVKSASRRYGEVTHIRFSGDELAGLKAIAERDGVTVSEVVRRLVRAEAGHLPIATEALRPAIVDMTDQLRRVGVNFNQAVRAMNDGRVAHDEDLELALIAVGDLVRQFRDELKTMTVESRKAREARP
ncbi:MobC family plasmid mobilization relaxosome protein [Mesorhizobium comanense]|jgi:predicted DNA-binding ribbon-helix-helix protein|uniref:MobC family plasmid mobilization relaxosome protein n=1 Tax=Mesorhizobium comanense TaxID=2502215 RepID=UPI0010F8AD8B|nr:MobC family plasmid mobilization relaxosome protein [Mesorhizobium comanense]